MAGRALKFTPDEVDMVGRYIGLSSLQCWVSYREVSVHRIFYISNYRYFDMSSYQSFDTSNYRSFHIALNTFCPPYGSVDGGMAGRALKFTAGEVDMFGG